MRAQGRGLFTGEHVCGRIPVFRSGTIGSAGNGSTVGAKKSPAGAGLSPNIRRSFMTASGLPAMELYGAIEQGRKDGPRAIF
jgi:hypothetical protein